MAQSVSNNSQAARESRFLKPYLLIVAGAGALVCCYCAARLRAEVFTDFRFLALAVVTVLIGSRLNVKIPRVRSEVTVSETFVFLSILLFGGEAAVLVAALEAFYTSIRFTQKWPLRLFNAGAMACCYFLTITVLRAGFGPLAALGANGYTARFALAICLMASAQFAFNTGLVAGCLALRAGTPFFQTWRKHFLYTFLTYFAGASAAGILVRVISTVGFAAFIASTPVIAVIYFTYWTYLKKDEAVKAQLEQAERHVNELNEHIAEQERISRALEEAKEHFRHAALHDPLTGLPNRSMLVELLRAEIETAKRRPGHLFAVLFLDLDRFKNINDSLGHAHGDLLLVSLAQRLEGCIRGVDTLARFGGDEFAILLSDIGDATDAVRIAERIQAGLAAPFTLASSSTFTSISIGIAISGAGYELPEEILRDADTAMYRAKENGKGRYELFDQTMHANAVARLRLESDLRRAVEKGELRVHYQPIVALDTGRLAGFEALVRWQHPERGLVSPGEFIPVAEETGQIVQIGAWVFGEACRQLCAWRAKYSQCRALKLSINLSARQIAQPDLADEVARVLKETGMDSHLLNLEITESVVMENAEAAAVMLRKLRALGVRLSIDDFGTGYSSLSYLHRFPVNHLKIDRSFVGRINDSGENFEIVRTITLLAHNLGMGVVAEGIETVEQYGRLRALACEYGQGYYFSPPVPAEVAESFAQEMRQWLAGGTAVPGVIDENVEAIRENYLM